MASKSNGFDDMVELPQITEKDIGENLRVRLKKEVIYTYIGRVLIAVNPFKALKIYGSDAVDFYRGGEEADDMGTLKIDDRATRCTTAQMPADILDARRRSIQKETSSETGMFKNIKGPKPPHLYALTNTMYQNMMMEHENQCVIISGESGAGKTVSAKHIMNFISKVSGKGSAKVENIKDIIIQSNPLLEAFGNAKTTRNNNSSRFGKFMEIQFNYSGHPDGGKVSNFLLEKSRVVTLNQNERNYHVFYQLLAGCAKENRTDVGIEVTKPETYYYLNQTGVYTVDGTNDTDDYHDLIKAMTVVGFDPQTQVTILKLVSAILHLGNVQFKEENNVAVPINDDLLTMPAKLLSVNKDLLKEKLVSTVMEARWGGKVEITKKTNNAEQAQFARDALAKALYSQVFDYLVRSINEAMSKEKDEMSIGVLDIYGFEIFENNQFEQFAINFVNEKLQQIFIELTLKTEQEEYVQEGIPWQEVKYFDNKTVCELIESKRPPGVMCTLDDVCSTMHAKTEGSEKTLMEDHENNRIDRQPKKKLRAVVASNKDFSRYFRAQSNYFTITHYAGNVDYEAKGFCEKNKDILSNDMVVLMQSSEDAFVKDLFPVVANPDSGGGRRGGAKSNTAGAKIKSQAAALITKIMSCTPHYVRCIKPTESKKPLDWDNQRVLHQIQYLGLKENIRVRRAGFAFRRQFEQVVRRYGIISPEVNNCWTGDPAEGCKIVMRDSGIDPSRWKIGKTKLFLKEPNALNELEDIKNKILEKYCVKIQGVYRTYRLRKRFLRIRKGVVVIQKGYRRYRDRHILGRMIAIKKLLKEVDVLGDKKKRRDSWDMGFKGDYVGFQNQKPLQKIIADTRVEFAAEVNKYCRDGKEQDRLLILTTSCLYVITQTNSSFTVRRKLPMTNINHVTVSPNDDSFFILHAKEYDNIFECRMLPEALNRLAVVYQLERNSELQLNVSDKVDFHIKGGDVRHVCFLEKGESKLKTSPSKKTFTVAADVGSSVEDVEIPGVQTEKIPSIGMSIDKVEWKLSSTYGVNVPDPSAFSAVAKAIFGLSGGSVKCKEVLVDLPEGSLTSKTKEVCIQLCRDKKQVAPLSDAEKIISHVVELSPHGQPLCMFAELCLPIEENVEASHAQFLRWTPTQSGEKANWSDVFVCDKKHRSDESQIALEFSEGKARVFTKHFGIFGIIATEEPKAHQTSIKDDVPSTSTNHQREDDTPTLLQRIGNMFKRGDTQTHISDTEDSCATSPSADPAVTPPPVSPVSSIPPPNPGPSAPAPPNPDPPSSGSAPPPPPPPKPSSVSAPSSKTSKGDKLLATQLATRKKKMDR